MSSTHIAILCSYRRIRGLGVVAGLLIASGCAGPEPRVGMAVEDFKQACFESDRARGKLVFVRENTEIYYCDLWRTHYEFEDGVLVRVDQEFGQEEAE